MPQDYSIRHPEYQKREPEWQYNRDHYEAGRHLTHEWTAGKSSDSAFGDLRSYRYLARHEAEDDRTFFERLNRAPGLYLNLVAHALLVYRSHVMRIKPQRTLPDVLQPMELDADLFGTSAESFFTNVFDESQLQGISYVLVDAPALTDGLTEAAARERRLRPWLESLRAEALVDWQIETQDPVTRGELRYAVVKDTVLRRGAPFEPTQEVTRYRVWTREAWELYESEGKSSAPALREGGPNRVGRVPIVPCYDRMRAPMEGGTVMDEVARKANALWNRSSVRDENFYRQGFSLLVIASDALEKDKALDVGASRGLLIGKGESASYESPPPGIFTAYAEFAREMIEQSADLVFARTARHQLPSAQIESAAKREVDRREFVALLEAKAARIEECERLCWEMAGRYYGIKPAESETWVSYSRDFRVHQLEAAEWVERIHQGVASPVEWRLALHPEESEAEATEAVLTNLSEWAGAAMGSSGAPDEADEESATEDEATEGEMPEGADSVADESASEG